MTLRFQIRRDNPEEDDHCIVGYDPLSERPVYTKRIPSAQCSLLHRFVKFERDDPSGYDSYAIKYADVKYLVALLGGREPPERLDYFIEPWVSHKQDAR
jgi:hypothetical protein